MRNLQEKKRGQNVGFVLIEEFENKSELDQFFAENEFSSIYNHHMDRTCKIGSEETIRVGNPGGLNGVS